MCHVGFNSLRVLLQPWWRNPLRSSPPVSILSESYCNASIFLSNPPLLLRFNSLRVLLQLDLETLISEGLVEVSILSESYCNRFQAENIDVDDVCFNSLRVLLQRTLMRCLMSWLRSFNSLRVLLQHSAFPLEKFFAYMFQFSQSLIATDWKAGRISAKTAVSILSESYCNEDKIVREGFLDLSFNSLRVLLQPSRPRPRRVARSRFNSLRVLLQLERTTRPLWKPFTFQFSQSLIATGSNMVTLYTTGMFQFSQSLIATHGIMFQNTASKPGFNSLRVLLQPLMRSWERSYMNCFNSLRVLLQLGIFVMATRLTTGFQFSQSLIATRGEVWTTA